MSNYDSTPKGRWAARLILDDERDHEVIIVSADKVVVQEIDENTPVAQTEVTEPMLLTSLLNRLEELGR